MDPLESQLFDAIRRAACDDEPRFEHRARLRDKTLAAYEAAQSRAARRGRILSFLLHHVDWRTIMRHPVWRWSAVAVLLIATGTACWFVMDGSTTSALANFADPIINAKSAKFTMTSRAGGNVVAVSNLLVRGPRMRMEVEQPNGGRRQIDIRDEESDRALTLLPNEKQAELIRFTNRPANTKTGGFLDEVRKMLVESNVDGKTTRELLDEREVDGRKLVGYRLTNPAMTLELWGDPATGLPHSIIQTLAAYPGLTHTVSNFEFDTAFDESLLSLEPPAGYQVSEREIDMTPPNEAALMAALQTAAELNGGVFPDALNMEIGHDLVRRYRENNKDKLSADDLEKEVRKLTTKIVRGFGFTLQFPVDKNRYSGKGVKLGTPNQKIYWYQPEGKSTYRVVDAELTVVETDKKPATE
jgi:outer membrane lipoprotein-sorting protein